MFDNLNLYLFLKKRKLKFWKHRCLKRLRKRLIELEERYNNPFALPYLDLIAIIELEKINCYINGYNIWDIRRLKEQLEKEK